MGRKGGKHLRLTLALATLVGTAGLGALVLPGMASGVIGWESYPAGAAPLPNGPDVPDTNPGVGFTDVACSSDGTCLAVGQYESNGMYYNTLDSTYPGAAGAWTATEPPVPNGFPAAAGAQPFEDFAVACYNSSPYGTCLAAGAAEDGSGGDNTQAVVDSFSDGTWTSTATPLPTDATFGAGAQSAALNGIACPAVGSCVAVGAYNQTGTGDLPIPLIETLSGGTWSQTVPPNNSSSVGPNNLTQVACFSATSCTAMGAENGGAMVDTGFGTSWSSAALPLPSSPAPTDDVIKPGSLACASDDTCIGTVSYPDMSSSSGKSYAVYDSYQGGLWSVGPTFSNRSGVFSSACPTAGTCMAVGMARPSTHSQDPLVETFTTDNWNQTVMPQPANSQGGYLDDVTCAADGTCAAVGQYYDGDSEVPLVGTYQSNTWSAYPYAPSEPNNASFPQSAELTAVTCAQSITTGCTAWGDYQDVTGNTDGLVDDAVQTAGDAATVTVVPTPFTASTGGTYTVNVSGGNGAPTGTVTVVDDSGNACPALIVLSPGTGTCTVPGESVGGGPYNVTAAYSGDLTYLPATAAISLDPEPTVSGTASATTGDVSVTASGGGANDVVTATQYPADPVGAPSAFSSSGVYVDAALAQPTGFTSATIIVCSANFASGDQLYWYDSRVSNWAATSPIATFSSGCLSVTLNGSTSPTLAELDGTVFGAGIPVVTGFAITTTSASLPAVTPRAFYNAQLGATGGPTPYRWHLVAGDGTLPRGLRLHLDGVLSGTPRRNDVTGAYSFTVKAATHVSRAHPREITTKTLSLVVS